VYSHLALLNEAKLATGIATVPRTIEIVQDAVDQGEKVIVFTMYTQALKLLVAAFPDALVVDGNVSQKARQDAVDTFQDDPTRKVFIGQLKAAGEGLNLTAATNVVMNDLDWVPANHLQGEDRAYRIGQDLPVNVTYLVAAGTFSEDLAIMLESKLKIVNDFEGTEVSLFEDLIERLQDAPKNEVQKRNKEDF
jgi:SWI/SNF-related matrix-associated actin-dependent regulator 1 of chromatin subfamily A